MSSVVGIDLGGTKVCAAELLDGRLGDSHLQPTDLSGPEALIDPHGR
jgi:hypothetical protein